MDKRVAKYSKVFKRAVAHAGIVEADACVGSFRRRIDGMYRSDLFRDHDVYPTIDVSHVYAVIAMCLELRERGLADSEIRAALDHGFAARRCFFDVLVAAVDLLPNCWAIVRRWNARDHERRVADGSIGYETFEAGERLVRYNIVRCGYVDMFDAWGVRPLCKIFCDADTRLYARLTRHVKFVRHSDLSDGDCCRDEIYERGYGE